MTIFKLYLLRHFSTNQAYTTNTENAYLMSVYVILSLLACYTNNYRSMPSCQKIDTANRYINIRSWIFLYNTNTNNGNQLIVLFQTYNKAHNILTRLISNMFCQHHTTSLNSAIAEKPARHVAGHRKPYPCYRMVALHCLPSNYSHQKCHHSIAWVWFPIRLL